MLLRILSLLPLLYLVHYVQPTSFKIQCGPCCKKEPNKPGCRECEEIKPEDCSTGQLTSEQCGCCKVCAKDVDDKCGSLGQGTCADHLFCQFKPTLIFAPGRDGICKKKKDGEKKKYGQKKKYGEGNLEGIKNPDGRGKTVKKFKSCFKLCRKELKKKSKKFRSCMKLCCPKCISNTLYEE